MPGYWRQLPVLLSNITLIGIAALALRTVQLSPNGCVLGLPLFWRFARARLNCHRRTKGRPATPLDVAGSHGLGARNHIILYGLAPSRVLPRQSSFSRLSKLHAPGGQGGQSYSLPRGLHPYKRLTKHGDSESISIRSALRVRNAAHAERLTNQGLQKKTGEQSATTTSASSAPLREQAILPAK
jgi:hypothetical protein